MIKADLHVHSKYSDVPATWFHKAYESPESFTEPEQVYQQAKKRGMDFVTLTDHDDIRGSLELVAAHPEDCFISCEITSYFPEDNCKVHILVYGITGEQYAELSSIRKDLYRLRDYIKRNDIAYSVAHATYDQDGLLRFHHIEKLVLLFDVFEVINGGGNERSNVMLHDFLIALTPDKLQELQEKYQIQPISDDPWLKGFTGGSDDHCGILIGSAYTQAMDGNCVDDFIQSLKKKSTTAAGRFGDFESYSIGVFKHIHDYKQDRDKKYRKTKMNQFMELFFTGYRGNWLERFRKSRSLRYLKRKNSKLHKALFHLLDNVDKTREDDMQDKIPVIFSQITELNDELVKSVINGFSKNLPDGNFFKFFQNIGQIFPFIALSAPFVGSLRHQILRREIRQNLQQDKTSQEPHKLLWVTDTIDDLNGVSVSLRQMVRQADRLGYNMKLVTCVDVEKLNSPLPDGTLNIAPIKKVATPGYEQLEIFFPSLLTFLKEIIEQQPDEIVISTPGPLGTIALAAAKLLELPVKGVYHTDFAEQVMRITGEKMLANMVDGTINSFYRQLDYVYVPSNAYIDILESRGLQRNRLGIFPRGLDDSVYQRISSSNAAVFKQSHCQELNGEFTLLFAGRISKDKNLELLADVFIQANNTFSGRYNLVVAGDGPYLPELKAKLEGSSNVLFTGRIDAQELVNWYSTADLFVFPSHTDTFGMVVLEGQACGLPCLVTNSGGPREIIVDQKTGHIVHTDKVSDWLDHIHNYYIFKTSQPEKWAELQQSCISRVIEQNSWQSIFDYVLGDQYRYVDSADRQINDNDKAVPVLEKIA